VPHYNVMGVAKAALEASTRYPLMTWAAQDPVNCISAGPVNTLAHGHRRLHRHAEALRGASPLKRNVLAGGAGRDRSFLASDGAAPSRARSFTLTAATRSWGCEGRAGTSVILCRALVLHLVHASGPGLCAGGSMSPPVFCYRPLPVCRRTRPRRVFL